MSKSIFVGTSLCVSFMFTCFCFSLENHFHDVQSVFEQAMVTPKRKKETCIKKKKPSNFNSVSILSHKTMSNQKISFDKFKSILLKESFPESSIEHMWCIAKNESSFNPLATNYNANGSFDVGLFQINQTWKRWCHMKDKDLLDVKNNAQCALLVLKKQGYFAWVTFKKFCL